MFQRLTNLCQAILAQHHAELGEKDYGKRPGGVAHHQQEIRAEEQVRHLGQRQVVRRHQGPEREERGLAEIAGHTPNAIP